MLYGGSAKTKSKVLSGIFFNSSKQFPLIILLKISDISRFNLKLNQGSKVFI